MSCAVLPTLALDARQKFNFYFIEQGPYGVYISVSHSHSPASTLDEELNLLSIILPPRWWPPCFVISMRLDDNDKTTAAVATNTRQI